MTAAYTDTVRFSNKKEIRIHKKCGVTNSFFVPSLFMVWLSVVIVRGVGKSNCLA